MHRTRPQSVLALGVAAGSLLACAAASRAAETGFAFPPPQFVRGPVIVTTYDGTSDDLLTAGLGAAGLAAAVPPAIADPVRPTAAELRRLAIYANYRALVDTSPGGGYGLFYGPGANGSPEKIAGREYLAYSGGRGGRQNVTMLVQIPASFDPNHPCVITGPSSGSRGVYGAIGTAGEWGLKKGCAVAYTDKGTGNGAHDLENDRVTLIDGVRVPAREAGDASHFTARLSEAQRASFIADHPYRYAWKHAHSELNPERDWGRDVIQSLEFALWALNVENARDAKGKPRPRFTWANTIVIASSVSNGGGASLRAAEQAPKGMIDGVAVSEPNVNPRFDRHVTIRQGNSTPLTAHSRSLIDYTTLINLFQGCANASRSYVAPPLAALLSVTQGLSAGTCRSLKAAGLLQGSTLADQAAEAQRIINDYGILPDQNAVQPAYWLFAVPQSISVTYANAYARASVLDSLCGYSFAATSPVSPFQPVPLAAALDAQLFGTASGIPPTGGVQLVNDRSVGGATRNDVSVSPIFRRQDQNVEGALCLRTLATGVEPRGEPVTGIQRAGYERVQEGVSQIKATGKLGGIPTVIVQGRDDAILPPNHTSRPYYALSQRMDGKNSRIRYYEVLNAQHLDAFNAFPDFAARLVPLHVYYFRALDLLWAHLTKGSALAPSQVVRTTPRGAAMTPLAASNVPPIAAMPAKGDRIIFDGRRLVIPD